VPFGRASDVSRGPVTAPAFAIQVISPCLSGLVARRESVSEEFVAHPDVSRVEAFDSGAGWEGLRRESGPGAAPALSLQVNSPSASGQGARREPGLVDCGAARREPGLLPSVRGPNCPVAPLPVTKDLRTPSARSPAAGLPRRVSLQRSRRHLGKCSACEKGQRCQQTLHLSRGSGVPEWLQVRRQAGRYLLTCAVSPGPRAGSGGTGQVRRCRQSPRGGDAARCCCLFEEWLKADAVRWRRLEDLRGRRLRCHCASGTPCHTDSLVRMFCTKMVEGLKAAGHSPSAGARRESGMGVGNLSPSLTASNVSAEVLPANNDTVGLPVSLGDLPGTAAARRAFPPTCCLSSSQGGRRESAASPGNLPGQASAARAFPAVTLHPRGRGDSTACTSGNLPGQHLSDRAYPVDSSGGRGPGNPRACIPGDLPGQHPPVRAFPSGGSGRPSSTTKSLVDNSGDLQVFDAPVLRAPWCPVVPLEVLDDVRAPGAGSLAAGRTAPVHVPEVADLVAAASREMAASGLGGLSEDFRPPGREA